MLNLASFWKPEACGQTVLPDRSVLIGQKLVENAKIEKKFKCDILSNFQTMCWSGQLPAGLNWLIYSRLRSFTPFVVFSSGFLTLDPMEVLSALSFWQQVSPPWKVRTFWQKMHLSGLFLRWSCPLPIFFNLFFRFDRTWKEMLNSKTHSV